ncbi:MAG: acyl carrier protein [Bacilli bacterium]|nr:acyl carrier protein [Bacilli bacterium]
MEEIKQQILSILSDIRPDYGDWENNKELVHSGILDSLGIVTLIGELSDAFDISIPPQEIVYENFDSLIGLVKMVERLSE